MKIINRLIPAGKYNRPGTKSDPKRICVHYTGDVGATADRLALFYCTNPLAETSAQYVVGFEGELIRCVPDNEITYAASGQNADTIHIEVCYKNTAGRFTEQSIKALRELVQYLMNLHNIPADKVVRHYDLTGKHCPAYYIDSKRWAALHKRITAPVVASATKVLYRVQIGAFAHRKNAESYKQGAIKKGYSAFVTKISAKLYRVQIGAFSTSDAAENYAKQARADGYTAIVVKS